MNSKTSVITDTYTETRAKYVLKKIYDDFIAISTRGFDQFKNSPNFLKELKEDLLFIMTNEDLKLFQLQFINGAEERAVEYEIKSDGTIYTDNDSGGVNYWDLPDSVEIRIVIKRKGSAYVWEELQKRGWVSGATLIEGSATSIGAYSNGGYGATKKLIGW